VLYNELDEKYRRSMMTNAQLDNEKQALVYQVEDLKVTINWQLCNRIKLPSCQLFLHCEFLTSIFKWSGVGSIEIVSESLRGRCGFLSSVHPMRTNEKALQTPNADDSV